MRLRYILAANLSKSIQYRCDNFKMLLYYLQKRRKTYFRRCSSLKYFIDRYRKMFHFFTLKSK